jgi:hypothetical protein
MINKLNATVKDNEEQPSSRIFQYLGKTKLALSLQVIFKGRKMLIYKWSIVYTACFLLGFLT